MSVNNYRIYKPFKDKSSNAVKGSASQFEIAVKDKNGRENVVLFLTMAKEIPSSNENSAFAWDDESQSVNMKLGENDAAELIAVIRGIKSVAGPENGKGLFHKNARGNSALKFSYNDEKKNFALEISRQRDKDVVRVYHTVTIGEAMILQVLLEEFIKRKYDWNSAVPYEKQQ